MEKERRNERRESKEEKKERRKEEKPSREESRSIHFLSFVKWQFTLVKSDVSYS